MCIVVITVEYLHKDFSLSKHLSDLLGEDGVLLLYSSPSQPNMELRRVALTCMANICLRYFTMLIYLYIHSAVMSTVCLLFRQCKNMDTVCLICF